MPKDKEEPRTVVVLTRDELDAVMAALPIAWPQVEAFGLESEEDDPKLAAGMAEQARTMQRLYDRLVEKSDGGGR